MKENRGQLLEIDGEALNSPGRAVAEDLEHLAGAQQLSPFGQRISVGSVLENESRHCLEGQSKSRTVSYFNI